MSDEHPSLKTAIETWCQKRLTVYRASDEQIRIDANSAEAVTKDHVNRWLFELIQNADDAGANAVKVRITATTVYFADDGEGLKPGAISSISALHLSDKPAQAIGRKGLGFKAVYCVTREPAIFAGAEAVCFKEGEARQFLRTHGFEDMTKVPYTWLPHWLDRREEEKQDHELERLGKFTTVIRLPLREHATANAVVAEAKILKAHTLLTFHHLRRVEFETDTESWTIAVEPLGADIWMVKNGLTEQKWSIARQDIETPAESLHEFADAGDRARSKRAACLVASLFDGSGTPAPYSPPPFLHVFYPTEIRAPLDILLHAGFVTKSDRTAIVPFSGSPFNSWLAKALAGCVVEYVQRAFSSRRPEAGLLLLAPTPQIKDEGSVTKALWEDVVAAAKTHLRIPDCAGNAVLRTTEAAVFEKAHPGRAVARRIVSRSNLGMRLVHERIEEFPQAVNVLAKLGGTKLEATEVVVCLESLLDKGDENLLWDALEWLGQLKSAQGGDELVARIRGLKVVPLEYGQTSLSDLQGNNVSWRDGSWDKALPEWLPLKFLASWFQARLAALPVDSSVRKLLHASGLRPPSKKLLVESCAEAIARHWEQAQKVGEPGRFLVFLKTGDFELDSLEVKGVERCPVPTVTDAGDAWTPACKSYFGEQWGNDLLVRVYRNAPDIAWVAVPVGDKQEWESFFETLGVKRWPRLFEDTDLIRKQEEQQRLYACVGFFPWDVKPPLTLDRISPARMPREQFACLLTLLAQHWVQFGYRHKLLVAGKSGRSHVSAEASSLWWDQVQKLANAPCLAGGPAASLQKSWNPDETIRQELRPLLPMLDKALFENQWSTVRDWLRNNRFIRQELSEITLSEWKDIFGERMQRYYPAVEGEKSYQATGRCYEAALLTRNDGVAPLQVTLLARRGTEFAYTEASSIWLTDDPLVAEAFAQEVWQISFPKTLHATAARWLGLKRLADCESRPSWKADTGEADTSLTTHLRQVAPYILAKRSNDAPGQRDQFLAKLRMIEVRRAERLVEQVCLPGAAHAKEIERRWALVGSVILTAKGKDEANLGEALANLLERESDSDLFQNLISSGAGEERSEKLEQRGVPKDLISSCLSEFAAPAVPSTPYQLLEQDPSATGQDEPAPHNSSAPSGGHSQLPSIALLVPLKSPDADEWHVQQGEPRPVPQPTPTGGKPGDSGLSSGTPLAQSEKDAIEVAGLKFVEAQLVKQGWEVKRMPAFNPGFDIDARRLTELLRVEVKAHRRQASTIDLTRREWETYLESKQPGAGFVWQLWNVENLAVGTSETILTIYNDLPENALDAASFRVDLRRCKGSVAP
ncbi:MAG: ATP-binding protein [Opitutae bacterium]|nr:ATP-binding protein [Opitutae bacterium]